MKRISGIYGILPADLALDELLRAAGAALDGGVRVLQLRDKQQGIADQIKRAQRLRDLTATYRATLIINDSLPVAVESGADGVHLGPGDGPDVKRLRTRVGKGFVIGVSCKGDTAFADHALAAGADYVSFGAVYPTSSKAGAAVVGVGALAGARKLLPDANIVAIGGIDEGNLAEIKAAGADAAAVIGGLFGGGDVRARAQRLNALWESI